MATTTMSKLIEQAKHHIGQGVYDQHELFKLIYPNSGKHYATVRTAIHRAKTGNFK